MDPFDTLTKRQMAVYEFIRGKMRDRGYGPTVREIGANFDIASPNGVVCHLKALEKKGLITRDPGKSRAIELTLEPCQRGFPLAGRVAAGMLHEAAFGIAVASVEGLAIESLNSADVVVPDITAAFELLEYPTRLVATLRR